MSLEEVKQLGRWGVRLHERFIKLLVESKLVVGVTCIGHFFKVNEVDLVVGPLEPQDCEYPACEEEEEPNGRHSNKRPGRQRVAG